MIDELETKAKELMEKHLKSIVDELEMYDTVSSRSLPYVESLWEQYDKLSKKLKHESKAELKIKEYEVEDEMVEEKLNDAIGEYEAYSNYKEEYAKSHNKDDLDMAHQELEHFLINITDMFKDICEYSKDNVDERTLVKSRIKEIYQIFN
jgi:hypothetical protein